MGDMVLFQYSNNHFFEIKNLFICAALVSQTSTTDRYNYLPNHILRVDGMNSGNIVNHGGILPQESSTAVSGIDIFGFSSGSPLPPPSPAPPTTNNTQYSLLGGTTPSTVIFHGS